MGIEQVNIMALAKQLRSLSKSQQDLVLALAGIEHTIHKSEQKQPVVNSSSSQPEPHMRTTELPVYDQSWTPRGHGMRD